MAPGWRANLGQLAKCGRLTKQVQALMATELRRHVGMRIAIHPGCELPPVEAGNDGPRQPNSAATARPCVVSAGGRPNERRGSHNASKHARERVPLE